MIGALLMMAAITVANMRKKVLLHKLILIEVCMTKDWRKTVILVPDRCFLNHAHLAQSLRGFFLILP